MLALQNQFTPNQSLKIVRSRLFCLKRFTSGQLNRKYAQARCWRQHLLVVWKATAK